MGHMDPSGSIFGIVERRSRLQAELKEQVNRLGRSEHLESHLDLTAEGGHTVMCCQVHLGTVPSEIRKKSKFQTGNWVKKTLT